MGLGEVGYSVTPYAYWATNGALNVDYAVKPELAPPGGTDIWWQAHYGDQPDPAFILPWRYDPEKGFGLQEAAKRYQTKDLTFIPAGTLAVSQFPVIEQLSVYIHLIGPKTFIVFEHVPFPDTVESTFTKIQICYRRTLIS